MPETLIKTTSRKAFDLTDFSEQLLHFWLDLQGQVNKHLMMDTELLDEEQQPVTHIAKYIQRQLQDFVQMQQKLVEQVASGVQLKLYNQSLYAHAALIDEQILNQLNWGISHDWLPMMMELSLFNSRNSGVKLIAEMERFSSQPHNFTIDEKKLAEVYLKVIWLGFSGNYRVQPHKLEQLTARLYTSAELTIPETDGHVLLEKAYKYNINPQKQSRLAPIARWRKYAWYSLIVYLITSTFLWFVITKDLDTVLDQAEQTYFRGLHD